MINQDFRYRLVLPSVSRCKEMFTEKEQKFMRHVAQFATVEPSAENVHFDLLKQARIPCGDKSIFLLDVFHQASGFSKLPDTELYFGFIESMKYELRNLYQIYGADEVTMRTSADVQFDPGKSEGSIGCGGGNYRVVRPASFDIRAWIDITPIPEGIREFEKLVAGIYRNNFEKNPGITMGPPDIRELSLPVTSSEAQLALK